MEKKRYVAYVGTYTSGNSKGIYIFDIDTENWTMRRKGVVPADNPSDLLVSKNKKYLYSVSDQGVNAYRILQDGNLEFLNSRGTGGMRGCCLETDPADRFLFVAGYHDGRLSVMSLAGDGSVSGIADGVFHRGVNANVTDRGSTPHVTCVKMMPDESGIFAADSGLDQVKMYDVHPETGKLSPKEPLRCDLDSGPRMLRVGGQGKFIYVLCERSNYVCVYRPVPGKNGSGGKEFEPVQKISTVAEGETGRAVASGIGFSGDGRHLFVSNAGINTVVAYHADPESGMLKPICSISCGGDYPKSLSVMPDNEHFVVLSQNSNEILSFKMDYEKEHFLMSAEPIEVEQPNSVCIHELDG